MLMAVVGIGIDVVDVARMASVLAGPRGARFRRRVFTAGERAECERQPRLRGASGAREVKLTGRVAATAREIGAARLLISLAHEADVAVAQAVAEGTRA